MPLHHIEIIGKTAEKIKEKEQIDPNEAWFYRQS